MPDVREHLLSSFFWHSEENCRFATPETSMSVFGVWFGINCFPNFPCFVCTNIVPILKGFSQIPLKLIQALSETTCFSKPVKAVRINKVYVLKLLWNVFAFSAAHLVWAMSVWELEMSAAAQTPCHLPWSFPVTCFQWSAWTHPLPGSLHEQQTNICISPQVQSSAELCRLKDLCNSYPQLCLLYE